MEPIEDFNARLKRDRDIWDAYANGQISQLEYEKAKYFTPERRAELLKTTTFGRGVLAEADKPRRLR